MDHYFMNKVDGRERRRVGKRHASSVVPVVERRIGDTDDEKKGRYADDERIKRDDAQEPDEANKQGEECLFVTGVS